MIKTVKNIIEWTTAILILSAIPVGLYILLVYVITL